MAHYTNLKDYPYLVAQKTDDAIPLTAIVSDDFEEWQISLVPKIQKWVKINEFKAAAGTYIAIPNEKGDIAQIFAGLGAKDEIEPPWHYSSIASSLPKALYYFTEDMSENDALQAAFGWAMGSYKFDQYLTKKQTGFASLVIPRNIDTNLLQNYIKAACLTRNLVNTPTCDMGPSELSAASKELADLYGASYKEIVGDDLLAKGYRTIHAVGRAALNKPRLIDIRWGNHDAPKVTLVGKGVCFDTGGLDIKPSSGMLIMKKDMGGAAHALGLGSLIMAQELNVNLRILIPAVENNIAGDAFRPGDIIKTYLGKTVEIGNTDAEGRLVLCDALALASEESPDILLDFATLTGAARVALGADIPPFFCDDAEFSNDLMRHSALQNDPLWHLPLYKPYRKLLKSSIADINNMGGGGFGGAITAALYLKDFVSNVKIWAHLDIYAWNNSDRSGRPKGGESMALRAVYALLAERYSK